MELEVRWKRRPTELHAEVRTLRIIRGARRLVDVLWARSRSVGTLRREGLSEYPMNREG
jgi:hypothetical protein